MRNISLEQFYKRINKKILVVGGYTENQQIVSIIKSCRLKPASIFSNTKFDFITLERLWLDEFNYSLQIKNKRIKIKKLSNYTHRITTDIFKNENINFILEHSKLACIGLYPDKEHFILLLMGTDNYWRCYQYINKILQIISPLSVGIKILTKCFLIKKMLNFKKTRIKSEMSEFKQLKWVLISLPTQQSFASNIIEYNKLRSILYQ